MPAVSNVLEALDRIAPARFALNFDRVGLQVGDPSAEVQRAVVSLDRSLAAVEYAESMGAQLLVSHHPLIFRPMDTVTASDHVGRTLLRLATSGIAFIAAHTNWDAAQGGVNDELSRLLGLQNVRAFGEAAQSQGLKLVFFCPAQEVESVIDAVSGAGAGEIGLYRRCAFRHAGTGTFIGLPGSNPAVGSSGGTEQVDEIRVEMVCRASDRGAIEAALNETHPYEEPAFDFFNLAPGAEQPIGRIGDLATTTTLSEWLKIVQGQLQTIAYAWGSPERKVRSIAVVGGAADDEWPAAQAAGADLLLTGEVKQHIALEASESGFALVAAGHYATEQPGAVALWSRLQAEVPDVEWSVFTPEPGLAGRPVTTSA